MIVTCNNCDTSFQLDESRVPEQGIRVRCSRCKEAFFLAHPSASASQAVHATAEQAVDSAGAPAPDVTQDLTSPVDPPAPPAAAGEGAARAAAAPAGEFNVEPPSPEPEEPALEKTQLEKIELAVSEPEQSEPAEHFGEVDIDELDEADCSGLSLEDEGADDAVSAAVAAGDDSAFGSVDDYSSLMPEEDTAAVEASEAAGEPVGPVEHWAPAAGRYASSGQGEDLGDPESWDLFGEDGAGASEPAARGAALGRIALTSASAGPLADGIGDTLADTPLGEGAPYDEEALEVAAPGPVLRAIGAVANGLGWAVTLALVSIAWVSGFWSTAESLVRTPQQIRLGTVELRDISGHWVDTARGETLLRVEGEIVNRADGVALLDGVLEVSLLDQDGALLDVPPQPAGLVLGEAAVRELRPSVLGGEVDRAAVGLARRPLAPGEPVAFQAVLRDVPSSASRVSLAIADGPSPQPAPVADELTWGLTSGE